MAGGSICAGIAGSRGGRPRKKKTLSRLGGMTRGFTDDFLFYFFMMEDGLKELFYLYIHAIQFVLF
jgi:dolichol kinase